MARETGASLSKDRCVRVSLLSLPKIISARNNDAILTKSAQ